MRFLVDESTGPYVARWLIEQGYQVFSVFEQARGLDDDAIIQKAFAENWILITNDKDFGEKVYRERRPHRGVILLRLDDERSIMKIAAVEKLLAAYSVRISDQFVVVTSDRVRFAHLLA
jgi:predicted nuclease of predicted toxin-antitoxin system